MRDLDWLDVELRGALRGCSLVCEAPLSPEVVQRTSEAFRHAWAQGFPLTRFPAITAVYLATAARERYREGALWPQLPLDPCPAEAQQLQQRLGEAFTKAIERLSLARLDGLVRERASRYVSFIVAHSGIPDYCIPDFLSLVTGELEHGSSTASDMIAGWRQSPNTKFKQTDKPVQRFLLYGGAVAENLLDRCIDLILAIAAEEALPDPELSGLPESLLDAVRTGTAVLPKSLSRRARIQAPTVRMQVWERIGPRIFLPEASHALGEQGRWEVETDIGLFRAPTGKSMEVILGRSASWAVRLCDSTGRQLRVWRFAGPVDGFLLFDGVTGLLLPSIEADPVRKVFHDRVLLVRMSESCERGPLEGARVVEDLGAFEGDWQSYVGEVLALEGEVARLKIGDSEVEVHYRAKAVVVESPPHEFVTSASGLDVYDRLPRLLVRGDSDHPRTQIEVRIDEGSPLTIRPNDPSFRGGELFAHPQLGWLAEHLEPYVVRVTYRGALGADQRESFVVVPRLRVERPARPPSSGRTGTVTISTATLPAQVVQYSCDATQAPFRIERPGRPGLDLLIRVPATVWRVSGTTEERALGREVVPLQEDDLRSRHPLRLWLRTGVRGQSVSIRLRDGERIGPSQEGVTSGPDGEWSTDLKQWADEVLGASTGTVIVEYCAGPECMEVARIATDVGLELLRIEVQLEPGMITLRLAGREHRRVSNRIVRFWRASQPWRGCLDRAVPDDVHVEGYEFAVSADELPPGRYWAQLLIDDGWNPLPRTPQKNRGVGFWVGDSGAARDWVNAHSQDSPTTAIERAWRFGEVVPTSAAPSLWLADAMSTLAAQAHLPPLEHNAIAVGRLVGAHHADFAALGADRLGSMELPQRLAVCLPLIGPIVTGTLEQPDEGVVERLWGLSAPWALACEARAGTALSECQERLGGAWSGGRLIGEVQRSPAETIVRLLGRPVEMLRMAIMSACPRPTRPCDPDALLRACFDWLITESAGRFSCADWTRRHSPFLEDAYSRSLCDQHWGTVDLLRGVPEESRSAARFPRMVTAAAWHATGPSERQDAAVLSLLDICGDVPTLVNWALIVAIVDRSIQSLGDST